MLPIPHILKCDAGTVPLAPIQEYLPTLHLMTPTETLPLCIHARKRFVVQPANVDSDTQAKISQYPVEAQARVETSTTLCPKTRDHYNQDPTTPLETNYTLFLPAQMNTNGTM